MISDEEIKGLIFKYIKSNGTLIISGQIKSTTRPENSTKEDAVISILDNRNAEFQLVTITVNVYVPDINPNGYFEEDGVRLKELSIICKNLFDKKSVDLLSFREFNQRVFKNESTNEHFVNNKIIYKFYNE